MPTCKTFSSLKSLSVCHDDELLPKSCFMFKLKGILFSHMWFKMFKKKKKKKRRASVVGNLKSQKFGSALPAVAPAV